jgi:hypothetical protein
MSKGHRFSLEQIAEFALKAWAKGIYPTYDACNALGLVCTSARYYSVVTPKWKDDNGIPHRRSRSRTTNTEMGYRSPIVYAKSRPKEEPKEPKVRRFGIKHEHMERELRLRVCGFGPLRGGRCTC